MAHIKLKEFEDMIMRQENRDGVGGGIGIIIPRR